MKIAFIYFIFSALLMAYAVYSQLSYFDNKPIQCLFSINFLASLTLLKYKIDNKE